MSLDTIRDKIVKAIGEKADSFLQATINQSYRQGASSDLGFMPPTSLEEIGAKTLEWNAYMRAYQDAITIVTREFEALMKPPAQESEEQTNDDVEPTY